MDNSSEDQDIFSKLIKVENKDIFVDVRKNAQGVYLKLSERRGAMRSSLYIPSSGIEKLQAVLKEAADVLSQSDIDLNAKRRDEKLSNPQSTIFVSNLSFSTTKSGLQDHFSQVGTVVKATIIPKYRSGRSTPSGKGIVEFDSPLAANLAIQRLDGTSLDDRPIKCLPHKSQGEQVIQEKVDASKPIEPTMCFIHSLSPNTKNGDLETFFGRVGPVKAATVRRAKNGRSLCAGVVEFFDAASAALAISTLHQKELDGRIITVREYYST